MDFQEIDVFIDPDGRVRIEVRGVKGLTCLELTEGLEAALGGQVESREMTADSYDSSAEEVSERRQERRGSST